MMKRRHKILIIEDNEINREIICEILKDDYNLLTAENGKIGMDIISQDREIDVIVSDIQMPEMDGYEVLKAVKSDPILKDIPIIITTVENEEHKCLQIGASDYIQKPFDPTIVRLRVDSVIRLLDSTRSDKLKTKFIQNMTHEMRTPLNAIIGFSMLMGSSYETLDDDERKMYCSFIENNGQLLIRMFDDVLELSDISNKVFTLKKEDVSLNDICKNALASIKYCMKDEIKLSYSSDFPESYMVNTDGKRVQQIIVNYLTNAYKFTQEGEIKLHCAKDEKPGYITISVADTGIGVPADKAEYVFGRFHKLDMFTQGNGLGLSVVKSFTKYLDGNAYLDTTYTKGARFVFELPVKQL